MKDVINVYLSELIKLRRTFAFWLTVLGAAIIPLTMLITYVYNWHMFIPASGANPWAEMYARAFNGIILFMPLYIILLIGLTYHLEYKANAWKHLFVLPVSKRALFLGKYLIVLTMVFSFMTLFLLFTWIAGGLVGFYKAELGFRRHNPDVFTVLDFSIKVLIAVLAIISIHFWLGLKIRNLVSVLGIGLAGMALAILMNGRGGYADFFPYAYPIMLMNYVPSSPDAYLERFHWVSLTYFALFSLLALSKFVKSFRG
ncbi:MAG: hypothetical protein BGO21_05160 [Dyadobacter sp. 50-39]|uniref:ABC transporter permease n=1 Tax=Dyadobacter sp. 50-39 TaxID=1895756 RepID=UPI00095E3125|nr:ABC transporter permease [Dyadobacter sp. 50-39]OJV22548.1 MAG: hypothetical protein BGO21_05160 [Dyadobacter sp. 50-39]